MGNIETVLSVLLLYSGQRLSLLEQCGMAAPD
jgi:hypothetical protein